MTETPESAWAREVVDDLEDRIVDVDRAAREDPGSTEQAVDEADLVPGSPEPSS